jgi:signal transduction histidine kinase
VSSRGRRGSNDNAAGTGRTYSCAASNLACLTPFADQRPTSNIVTPIAISPQSATGRVHRPAAAEEFTADPRLTNGTAGATASDDSRYDTSRVTVAPSLPASTPPFSVPVAAISSRRLSLCCAASVIAVGGIVLLGWQLQMPAVTGLFGTITMKTNGAIALMLCGIAVLLLRRLRFAAAALGLMAALLGAATLFEHVSGQDLGIDQALFTEAAGAEATASPNRMGLPASISFVMAGTAILLLTRRRPRATRLAQRLAFIGVALALIALAGYIYGVREFFSIAAYTGIAWHSAGALLLLHVGILTASPESGPMARFVSDGPEGTMLRRLTLPISVAPFVAGYMVLMGPDVDFYDRGLSLALLALSLVILLWFTVWHTARALASVDQQRRQAEHARDQLLIREREARDEAEQANHLKDRFIATLSHELRTPLNVMLGWTQVLESRERAARHPHAASVVARNGRLLARLIEDLLDISRATAGQFELTRKPLSLNLIVQAAIESIGPVAAGKGLHVAANLDPSLGSIEADADRLQQVVWNMLSNAVKFTPAGGRIEVRTSAAADRVLLEVIDSGVGFDESFAPHIFEPFRQADPSTRREHGGLGLGLSIARHLIELHGGSIAAHSAGIGHGARITVTLPAATVAPGVPTPFEARGQQIV